MSDKKSALVPIIACSIALAVVVIFVIAITRNEKRAHAPTVIPKAHVTHKTLPITPCAPDCGKAA